MVTSCRFSVRSMLPHPVLRHAGGRLAPASQCCPWRCAACRNAPAALTGARGASCREWSERLEARGCRSTLRRMRAAKAARQATGIVATRSPLLQLCFADQKRPSFNKRTHQTRGGRRTGSPPARAGSCKDDQGHRGTGAGSASRHGGGLGRVHPHDRVPGIPLSYRTKLHPAARGQARASYWLRSPSSPLLLTRDSDRLAARWTPYSTGDLSRLATFLRLLTSSLSLPRAH